MLDTFVLAMIGFAVAVVLGVALLNAWQIRRAGKRSEPTPAVDFNEASESTMGGRSDLRSQPRLDNESPVDVSLNRSGVSPATARIEPSFGETIEPRAEPRQSVGSFMDADPIVRSIDAPPADIRPAAPGGDWDTPPALRAQASGSPVVFERAVIVDSPVPDVAVTQAEAATEARSEVSDESIEAPETLAKKPAFGAAPKLPPELDARIRSVAQLQSSQPFRRETLLNMIDGVVVESDEIWWLDEATQHWRRHNASRPMPSTSESRTLVLGRLLADRHGPIDQAQLSQWSQALAHRAQGLGLQLLVPDVEQDSARAAQLDAFCASVDFRLRVTLKRPDGMSFPGTLLRGVLEANGFKPRLFQERAIGNFDYENDRHEVLFCATQAGRASALTPDSLKAEAPQAFCLEMDVPRVTDALLTFDQFRVTARQLCTVLKAEIYDDTGNVLLDEHFLQMRKEVDHRCQTLVNAELRPGSPAALALFNTIAA